MKLDTKMKHSTMLFNNSVFFFVFIVAIHYLQFYFNFTGIGVMITSIDESYSFNNDTNFCNLLERYKANTQNTIRNVKFQQHKMYFKKLSYL